MPGFSKSGLKKISKRILPTFLSPLWELTDGREYSSEYGIDDEPTFFRFHVFPKYSIDL